MRDRDLPDHLLHPCPFMYGIQSPDGSAYMDECCVDTDRAALKSVHVPALNEALEEGEDPYKVVALYTAEQVEAMLASQKNALAEAATASSASRLHLAKPPAAHCGAAFWRQPRYLVFKKSDLYALALAGQLSGEDSHVLASLADKLANNRTARGKQPLRCVVVENDWPEYEPTRTAIEKRMTGQ